MTVRLTVRYGDRVSVEEYASHAAAYFTLVEPHVKTADLVVLQELDAPEETTWGQVNDGDEIIAPDGSCWRLEGSSGDGQVYLAAIDDGRPLTFAVTDDMPIRRRPGVLSAAAQLLHDVGLWSGR
jgi:hypothetical protein